MNRIAKVACPSRGGNGTDNKVLTQYIVYMSVVISPGTQN